ncbi:UDP-glucose 4-epimerase-like [Physella acuta]|uniref:UDP-glucose 4-epimerase-like n=1 Tax=Physella acuta TaxID=109671 RepID=UPI0027DB29F3|nr:UDP-glucose 4-epimerase-like [Physella acuta]XP_059175922.1 UDP-glucose 4-epimerase-like [Physella acuta]XP_059175923.1 UDP-glucose 4-epimerase-like [Physella acuta]XP_059175924.1 UDP-glucose 4-epimerase-like [Physella acuta]
MASGAGKKETILVTGGAGYVGSHTVITLLEDNYDVVVIDNFANGNEESIHRIESLTKKKVPCYNVDLLRKNEILSVFHKHPEISVVIHFAALKAVGESVKLPLLYYRVNVLGTINLVEAMDESGVTRIIFSSSATVYGDPKYLPMDEKHPVGNCTSPYAKTKHFVEEILFDICRIKLEWSAVVLRYFNPVGAHSSGVIGEDPQGVPNNLTPYVSQVAIGKRNELLVYGDDYDTPDGTGVRDYLHITDLARGHIAAMNKVKQTRGFNAYNLGTGKGSSVLDVIKSFEKVSGRKINYKIVARRDGDVATMCADPHKAEVELGWTAKYSLDDMCRDLWNWQTKNPNGFKKVNGVTEH